MFSKFLLIFLTFVSIISFSQEIDENFPKEKAENYPTYYFQNLITENAAKAKVDQELLKIIPIPTVKPLNAELYTILNAPINKKYEYKILNMFPENSELTEPNLVKK